MRKFVGYLPVIATVFGVVYGLFDARVYAFLVAHKYEALLSTLLVLSETIANTDIVKSNSIAHAIFDFVDLVLSKVLRKPA